jgi:hypothetical protein
MTKSMRVCPSLARKVAVAFAFTTSLSLFENGARDTMPTHQRAKMFSGGVMTPKLEVEVRETLRRLIVRMPGTRYAMEFAQTGGRLCLVSGGVNNVSSVRGAC